MALNATAMLFGRFQIVFVTLWPLSTLLLLPSKIKVSYFSYLHLYFFSISLFSFSYILITSEYTQDVIYPIKCLLSIFLVCLAGIINQKTVTDHVNFLNILGLLSISIFLLSFIGGSFTQQQWIGGAYNGFFANRNGCAFFFSLLSCYYLGKFLNNGNLVHICYFFMLSVIVLLTMSRTGFGATVLLYSYLAWFYIKLRPMLFLPLVIIASSIVYVALRELITEIEILFQILLLINGEGHNVSERQSVYAYGFYLLENAPIFGYGFYTFGDLSPYLKTHAHNIFIQGFADLGILFVPIFVGYLLYFITSLRNLIIGRSHTQSLVFVVYILFSLVTLPIATPTSAIALGLLMRKDT